MKYSIISTKLVGNPDTSGWCQVHEFAAPEDKQQTHGKLYVVLAIKQDHEGVESVALGRELLSQLHSDYFEKESDSCLELLKNSIGQTKEKFAQKYDGVELGAAAVFSDAVYLTGSGLEAGIYRNGSFVKILKALPGELAAVSGHPQDNDILVLATSAFFQKLPSGILNAALEKKAPDLIAEFIAPTVHALEETGLMGGVFVGFSKTEQAEEQPEETVEIAQQPDPFPQVEKPEIAPAVPTKNGWLKSIASKLPAKKVYLRKSTPDYDKRGSKRKFLTVGVMLLALLITSIGFGVKQKSSKDKFADFEEKIILARGNLDEANSLAITNPDRAKQLYLESKEIIEQLTQEGADELRLAQLKEDIQKQEGVVLGQFSTTSELYLDLGLLSENFTAEKMVVSTEKLWVWDKDGKKMASVSLDRKKTQMIQGVNLVADAQNMAAYSDRVFLVSEEGVYEVDTQPKLVLEKDWDGEVLISAYASNIYLLEKQTSKISRFAGASSGFGSKQNWLSSSTTIELSGAVDWAIDGSMWILDKNGTIIKLNQGNREKFTLSGITEQLNNADSIFTNELSQYLYILDNSQQRVVVFDKQGQFKVQYGDGKLGQAVDIAVSEEQGILVFLSGSELNFIELKHLQ